MCDERRGREAAAFRDLARPKSARAPAQRAPSGMFARAESALADSALAHGIDFGLVLSRLDLMGDPWHDEGFGGENDWDDGKESLETDVEDGFEDPEELDDAESGDDESEDE